MQQGAYVDLCVEWVKGLELGLFKNCHFLVDNLPADLYSYLSSFALFCSFPNVLYMFLTHVESFAARFGGELSERAK